MRVCEHCQAENPDDRDICVRCNAYIRWEPTRIVRAITEQEAAASRPETSADEDDELAALVLQSADGSPVNVGALSATTAAGQPVRVAALIRNQSRIVDHYDIGVEGLPDSPDKWWTPPETVYLAPFGGRGVYEKKVELVLHPPRSPEAAAREWELDVVATSASEERVVARAPLALTVLPYTETSTRITPQRVRGHRTAFYDVAVDNHANAPVVVALEGKDPDGQLRFAFDKPPPEVAAGATATANMRVRVSRPMLVGRRTERLFEISTLLGDAAAERLAEAPVAGEAPRRRYRPHVQPPARAPSRRKRLRLPKLSPPKLPTAGAKRAQPPPDVALAPSQAVFVQRPLIPSWLLPVLLLVAIPLAAFALLAPKTVTVPDITTAESLLDARALLAAEGLKFDPAQEPELSSEPPGTILSQVPDAGEEVEEGTAVGVVVAVSDELVRVPSIVKMNLKQADDALRDAGLELAPPGAGDIDLEAEIDDQLPAARERVKKGTPVQAVFDEPPAGEGEDGGGGPGGKPGVKKAGPVPAIAAGTAVAAALATLADAGITPTQANVISSEAAGTVAGTDPRPGTQVKPGDDVRLLVSAGAPHVAFEDGRHIFTVDTAGGKPAPFTGGPTEQKYPTWSPDGARLAYVSGGQIVVKPVEGDEQAQTVTPSGKQYRNLAWAPTRESDVLAMTLGSDTKRELCLGRLVGARLRPSCRDQPNIVPGRGLRWSRNGRTLLAYAETPDEAKKGIVRWRTKVPFSPDPTAWSDARFVTPTDSTERFVADAAPSPDGRRLALIANFSSDFFQVYITAPDDFKMNADPVALGVAGCKLAWRSDSRELAVVVADDQCTGPEGLITAVPLRGKGGGTLSPRGDNPVYQPIKLGD